MDGLEFVDFVALLPEEVLENILFRLIDDEPLSNVDFTNFRLVCKNWNERISSNKQLWKLACEKLGLNVKKDTKEADYYKGIFLRMRKLFQQMKNGGEVFCGEESDFPRGAACMHYHDGIVGIGSYTVIRMMELKGNLRVVSQASIGNCGRLNCIHFDDSYLVVGTDRGYLITFKMPTMEKLHTKMSHSDHISCLIFNKDKDLLVTASIGSVTFWCLSSGTVHFTQNIGNSGIKYNLHLIPSPNLPNGYDYMLICIGEYSSCKLHLNSQQITTAEVNPLFISSWDRFISSYFRNPFLYFVRNFVKSKIAILFKYDPASGVLEEKGRFSRSEKLLVVGVGDKYACLLQRINVQQKFIIYDLVTQSEVASFDIPMDIFQRNTMDEAYVVHGGFLDGFDGFNNKGIILIRDVRTGIFSVKWRE